MRSWGIYDCLWLQNYPQRVIFGLIRPFSGSGWGPSPDKAKINQESFEPNAGGCCARSWGIYDCLWLPVPLAVCPSYNSYQNSPNLWHTSFYTNPNVTNLCDHWTSKEGFTKYVTYIMKLTKFVTYIEWGNWAWRTGIRRDVREFSVTHGLFLRV